VNPKAFAEMLFQLCCGACGCGCVTLSLQTPCVACNFSDRIARHTSSGESCKPEAGASCEPSDSEGRVLRVTSTAWTTLQRSRMKVSRTTSLDSQQRMSHVTSYASTTSGRRGAVPVSRTRSAESFDSQESPASEKFSRQIAHSLYSLDKVATPPSSELESVGWGASPTDCRNELP